MGRRYRHIVQYYETDKMGITHHSNYIRWMEEARVFFLDEIGWSYAKLEESGIMSPVIAAECKYKISTGFADEIFIEIRLLEYNGIKMKIGYTMYNAEDKIVSEGSTEHCFLGEQGPIALKKRNPKFHQKLMSLLEG